MTTQLALRIPNEPAVELDGLVSTGRFATRAEAVHVAIAELVEREGRRAVGDAIVAGYRRLPETAEEQATAEQNLRRLVTEEPW